MIAPSINWANPLTKGLILDGLFFEGGGNTVAELVRKVSGIGSNLVWGNDSFGQYITFNGTNSNINFGTNVALGITNAVTMSALVFMPTLPTPGTGNYVVACNSTNENYEIDYDSTNAKFRWITHESGGFQTADTGNNSVLAKKWYQITAVLNAGTGEQKIYLNNALVYSFTLSADSIATTGNNLFVGSRPNPDRFFNGQIAYVRVWNRSLIAQEARQLYYNPWQIYRRPNLLPFKFRG